MKSILVIPSIREDSLKEFFVAWDGPQGDWDAVIVVEDNPQRSFSCAASHSHYAWETIKDLAGKDSWIFSRRDSAIRCFGIWRAWMDGADFILTLDDDVRPIDDKGICAGHMAAMNGHKRWISSVSDIRPRGLPYLNTGRLANVMANMGLWADVPDLDAIQTLGGLYPINDYEPPAGNCTIPIGRYMPICGMNLAFRREFAPLAYFPLMGQNQPYARFDDIFMGIIAKKICDHLDWHISIGEPHIKHIRASDPFTNLVKEAPGIKMNEHFWEIIDAVYLADERKDPIGCMKQMGIQLSLSEEPYMSKLGQALQVWAGLFK